MMLLLEANMNLDGLVYFFAAIMLGPALLLALIGILVSKKNKKAAKVLYILATVYVIISFGICGALISAY